MIKKGIRLLGIILMLVVIINIFEMYNTKSYADLHNSFEKDVFDGGGSSEGHLNDSGMQDVSKIPGAWKPSNQADSTKFNQKVGVIASVVRNVGILVSVGTLMAIGIKFMLGSVEEKAQYKQTLIPWLVGAILIFAMTSLPSLLYNMSQGMFN